jgi:hypothetical protein
MKRSWQISRRRLLRSGAGVTLGLPLLDVMAPAFPAQSYVPPTRMACLMVPNGVWNKTWFPEAEGLLGDLPEALKPLQPLRSQVTVFSGLSNNLCKEAPHHRAIAGFLTGADPKPGIVRVGVSADQIVAQRLSRFTRLPSLPLGLPEVLQQQGSCDGYSCVYTRNISWSSATTPVPKDINPRNAFDRMFRHLVHKGARGADEMPSATASQDSQSVLDYVLDDARTLRKRVSSADQYRVDQYFESLREVEKRINRIIEPEKHRGSWKPQFPKNLASPAAPEAMHEHLHTLLDLIVLAFMTDTTRVSTMMFGYGASGNSYPDSGVKEGHHSISHYNEQSPELHLYTMLNRYHVACFAYLVEKLRSTPEGEGTLLDNSMLLFGSELGQGGIHNVNNLPVVLAGRGGGTITPGRHVKLPSGTPMANLLLEMINRMQIGEPVRSFGESTGGIPQLRA